MENGKENGNYCLGFRVKGFRAWGLRFQVLGFGVYKGLGFRVLGLRFFGVYMGLGWFRVGGLRF